MEIGKLGIAIIGNFLYNGVEMKDNLKPIDWLGDSLRVLRSFPEEVQDEIGYGLFLVQSGLMPGFAS